MNTRIPKRQRRCKGRKNFNYKKKRNDSKEVINSENESYKQIY